MKKLKKILIVLLCLFVVVCVAGFFVLKAVLSDEKVKGYVQDAAQKYVGRQVSYDKMSFNIIGISLKNLKVSENPAFGSGNFIKVDRFAVKVKLLPLLRKEIRVGKIIVSGMDVKVLKNKDGVFNFDDIMKKFSSASSASAAVSAGQTAPAAASALPAFFLDELKVKNSNILYEDASANMSAALKNLNLQIEGFSFSKAFLCTTDFDVEYKQDKLDLTLPVTAVMTANLKNMDLSQAVFNLTSFSTKIEGMSLSGKASVSNVNSPNINAAVSAENITNETFKQFASGLPKFALAKVDAALKAQLDLEKSSANIENFSVSMQGASVAANGTAEWGKNLNYNIKATVDFALETLSVLVPDMVKPYDPKGKINATANVTPSLITAKANASGVSFKFDPMFTAESVGASVEVNSLDNIKLSSLSGLLNGKKFSGSASYLNAKDAMSIGLVLDMEGLIINAFPPQTAAPAAQPAKGQSSQPSSAMTPLNLNADLKIGSIKVPYFHSDSSSTLKANLTGVTDKLDKTNGTVTFSIGAGNIDDVQKLAAANKITKILFSAIAIVDKVGKTLNVGALSGAKNESGIGYDSFIGDMLFTDGKMSIKTMDFLSKNINMRVAGTTDFKADKLDMKASVQPGVNKPVIIKITGTTSNPKGSLDVVGSISSIFGSGSDSGSGSAASKIGSLLGGGKTSSSTGTAVNTSTGTAANQLIKGLGSLLNVNKSTATAK
ncbi:MAG: AsmA family protein [Endomicrobia bacterium]|nr:AsmA family protein [Endomicrobiia bacterium]